MIPRTKDTDEFNALFAKNYSTLNKKGTVIKAKTTYKRERFAEKANRELKHGQIMLKKPGADKNNQKGFRIPKLSESKLNSGVGYRGIFVCYPPDCKVDRRNGVPGPARYNSTGRLLKGKKAKRFAYPSYGPITFSESGPIDMFYDIKPTFGKGGKKSSLGKGKRWEPPVSKSKA